MVVTEVRNTCSFWTTVLDVDSILLQRSALLPSIHQGRSCQPRIVPQLTRPLVLQRPFKISLWVLCRLSHHLEGTSYVSRLRLHKQRHSRILLRTHHLKLRRSLAERPMIYIQLHCGDRPFQRRTKMGTLLSQMRQPVTEICWIRL